MSDEELKPCTNVLCDGSKGPLPYANGSKARCTSCGLELRYGVWQSLLRQSEFDKLLDENGRLKAESRQVDISRLRLLPENDSLRDLLTVANARIEELEDVAQTWCARCYDLGYDPHPGVRPKDKPQPDHDPHCEGCADIECDDRLPEPGQHPPNGDKHWHCYQAPEPEAVDKYCHGCKKIFDAGNTPDECPWCGGAEFSESKSERARVDDLEKAIKENTRAIARLSESEEVKHDRVTTTEITEWCPRCRVRTLHCSYDSTHHWRHCDCGFQSIATSFLDTKDTTKGEAVCPVNVAKDVA